jgi:outer membrane protein assembly factor BamB
VSAGGRIVAFGDDEPGGAALDISTGKRLWPAGTGCYRPVGASPDGAKFYMSCAERPRIQVVDAATGKVTATFPAYGPTSGFATDGQRVYMRAFTAGILAVDATTGSKAWSRSVAGSAPLMFSTGGGVVYGWRGSGHPIAAFEARTGRVIKLDAKTSAIEGQPLIANGRLYGRTASTVTTFAP